MSARFYNIIKNTSKIMTYVQIVDHIFLKRKFDSFPIKDMLSMSLCLLTDIYNSKLLHMITWKFMLYRDTHNMMTLRLQQPFHSFFLTFFAKFMFL
jgi:hypothetical protein